MKTESAPANPQQQQQRSEIILDDKQAHAAYANFARAWGAEVRGWDRRETIFLEAVDGMAEIDEVTRQIEAVLQRNKAQRGG